MAFIPPPCWQYFFSLQNKGQRPPSVHQNLLAALRIYKNEDENIYFILCFLFRSSMSGGEGERFPLRDSLFPNVPPYIRNGTNVFRGFLSRSFADFCLVYLDQIWLLYRQILFAEFGIIPLFFLLFFVWQNFVFRVILQSQHRLFVIL